MYNNDEVEDFLSEYHCEYVDVADDVEYVDDIEFFEKNIILDAGCFQKKILTN